MWNGGKNSLRVDENQPEPEEEPEEGPARDSVRGLNAARLRA